MIDVPFIFMSTDAFERLTTDQRLTYLSDAMEELIRVKVPTHLREWNSLFEKPNPPD